MAFLKWNAKRSTRMKSYRFGRLALGKREARSRISPGFGQDICAHGGFAGRQQSVFSHAMGYGAGDATDDGFHPRESASLVVS